MSAYTHHSLARSCVAGYENLAVWSHLLDTINVFPVADGDTGANLRISLAPLRDCVLDMAGSVERLSAAGLGNSGNIATTFLAEFLQGEGAELAVQAEKGRVRAYAAIARPVTGTMLDVFDALSLVLAKGEQEDCSFAAIRQQLQKSVAGTVGRLAPLKEAGVVDSGALGIFLFFDGFFQHYLKGRATPTPVMELFGGWLQIASSYRPEKSGEYCVEAVLAVEGENAALTEQLAALAESVVVVAEKGDAKVHLHSRNPEQLRKELSALGSVKSWSDAAIDPMSGLVGEERFAQNRIRILSDAAGSIPLSLAREHGIILLDSYIVTGNQALPESLHAPEKLYSLMAKGIRVTTAQASASERHLQYQASCAQYEKLLYICTGSHFTGNYSTARAWQLRTAESENFHIIDSGAASGRLAVIAMLTARFAETGASVDEVIAFATDLSRRAEEYVFIDELKYLVAGGRVSKTKGFFADLLHMKPVISPGFEGVRKRGVVRNARAQIVFALEKLAEYEGDSSTLVVLLQYSDNKQWLEQSVKQKMQDLLPEAEILLVPLSLTSGVHMGPGTWSIAYAGQ